MRDFTGFARKDPTFRNTNACIAVGSVTSVDINGLEPCETTPYTDEEDSSVVIGYI